MIVQPGRRAGSGEPLAASGHNPWAYWGAGTIDDASRADLTCYAQCGPGDFPLTLPAFAAEEQAPARAERGRLAFRTRGKEEPPSGATSVWDVLYAYARSHPRDPRSPEARYWLIRISRFGHIHGRLGYKSFRLLHRRYPNSSWTGRSPHYFD